MARKIRMIEAMWQVAYADGRLSEHERHVLWRIADLLHVPQGAYVHARMRAQQQAGERRLARRSTPGPCRAATVCRKVASSASRPASYLLPTGDFLRIAA